MCELVTHLKELQKLPNIKHEIIRIPIHPFRRAATEPFDDLIGNVTFPLVVPKQHCKLEASEEYYCHPRPKREAIQHSSGES